MQQRKSGIILSYITLVLNTLIGLYFTPFMIKSLGDAEFGLYQLIHSFAAYLIVINCGTGTAMTRYIVKYKTLNDSKCSENYIVHNLIVTVILMMIIVLAGGILFFNIGNVFKNLTYSEVELAKKLLFLMIINIAVSVPLSSFSGIITAFEKFNIINGFELIKILVRVISISVLLFFGVGSIAIISVDLFISITYLIYTILYCLVKLKVKIKYHYFDKVMFGSTFAFSFAIFLQAIINQLNNNVDRTVLGIYLTTKDVTVYSIAMNIYVIFTSIPGRISSVFLPKITNMIFSGSTAEDLTDQIIRVGRYQFMLGGATVVGFALVGKHFIKLWVGEAYYDAWLISLIIMIPYLFVIITSLGGTILDAKKKRMAKSLILLGTAIVNVICTVVLVKNHGRLGAPIGTAFSIIVGDLLCMNFYYSKVIGLNVARMYKCILKRLSICILIPCIPVIILTKLLNSGFLTLIAKITVYISIYALMLYKYGLTAIEKKDVFTFYNKVMKRRKKDEN